MHDTILADAFRPPRFTVLHLPLLDYTLGHEIVLWQRRNPLVAYGEASFSELHELEQMRVLKQAVLICSRKQSFGHRFADYFSRFLPQNIAFRLQKRLSKGWANRCDALDLADEVARFYEYRRANMLDLPTVKQPRVSGVPYHHFGSPEVARLLNYVTTHQTAMVQTHFGGSPLNFPFGLARVFAAAHAEEQGGLWVSNFHDAQVKAQAAAFEEAHPEGTLAIGEEAVQAAAEKWNREHPETPVPLPRAPKKSELGGKI